MLRSSGTAAMTAMSGFPPFLPSRLGRGCSMSRDKCVLVAGAGGIQEPGAGRRPGLRSRERCGRSATRARLDASTLNGIGPDSAAAAGTPATARTGSRPARPCASAPDILTRSDTVIIRGKLAARADRQQRPSAWNCRARLRLALTVGWNAAESFGLPVAYATSSPLRSDGRDALPNGHARRHLGHGGSAQADHPACSQLAHDRDGRAHHPDRVAAIATGYLFIFLLHFPIAEPGPVHPVRLDRELAQPDCRPAGRRGDRAAPPILRRAVAVQPSSSG